MRIERPSDSPADNCLAIALIGFRNSRGLSPIDEQHMRHIAAGHSNQQIAQERVVSVNTVKSELHALYLALGVHSRDSIAVTVRAARAMCAQGATVSDVVSFFDQAFAS